MNLYQPHCRYMKLLEHQKFLNVCENVWILKSTKSRSDYKFPTLIPTYHSSSDQFTQQLQHLSSNQSLPIWNQQLCIFENNFHSEAFSFSISRLYFHHLKNKLFILNLWPRQMHWRECKIIRPKKFYFSKFVTNKAAFKIFMFYTNVGIDKV